MMGSESKSRRAETNTSDRTAGDPLRLLFVEDDDDFQQVLRIVFSRVTTTHAVEGVFLSNITDAKRVVDSTRVDAIVSDYHLPDGNGVAFLDDARHKAPGSHRVILTGHPDIARTTESFDRSVQRLWDKSLAPKELQHRLEHLLHEMVQPAG
ncbi:MAG TPA: response regulator [Candidatus Thermoplasmatota archaeon]